MTDLVLNPVRKTVVEMVVQGRFTVAPELGCNPVKLDQILIDPLIVFHVDLVELVFGISDGVMGAEGELEFQDKLLPGVHP